MTVDERIDYFGQTVNIAARVQDLADAGEIHLTADVYDSEGVRDALETHEAILDEVVVKGVSDKLRVYKISAGSRAERS